MASPAVQQQRTNPINGRVVRRVLTYVILLIGAVIALLPFLWMISTSFMTLGEAQGLTLVPSNPQFGNYITAWERGNFTEYFINSVLITVITLVGEMTFSIMAAYAFARIQFPGRNVLFGMLLATPDALSPVAIPAGGGIVKSLLIPSERLLAFQSVYCQVLEVDPGAARGYSWSPGLEVVIWP